MYEVKSPVLFLIFNRPAETQILFEEIRAVKPKRLYVAADGPRFNGVDENSCKATRVIIEQIDWECELFTLFREENLGCRKAVSSAISWFFDQESEGIVLEDDCLPNADFFRFCDEMLEKYREDLSIGHICGCNFQDGIRRGDGDYYYSRLTHVWGWASWRRVWSNYDIEMGSFKEFVANDLLKRVTDEDRVKKNLYLAFEQTHLGAINTWDYQYYFSNVKYDLLSIIPNYNLISNIGFNANGTHTFDGNSPLSNVDRSSLPQLIKHPCIKKVSREADQYTLLKENPKPENRFYLLVKGILRGVKKVIG